MKRTLSISLSLGLLFAATAAQAGCYADYKAKKDNPLQLHYGVVELPQSVCNAKSNPAAQVQARLAPEGWTLLNVLSLFGDEGLAERKASAGPFFLRF